MKAQFILILSLYLMFANSQSFSDAHYQAQTAQQKMNQLWKEITADQTSANWYSTWQFAKIFLQDMKPTFDTYSDVMPQGRKKLIHTVGSVAQAELVSEKNNPYSGMFQGASNVIVRMSPAVEPNPKKGPEGNFIPSLVMKLLRDGMPSANLMAMYSVDGQDSFNIFKYDFSNHIPNAKAFTLMALAKKFSQATPFIGRIGLKNWGQYDEKGKKVEDSKFKIPFKLIFRPSSEVHTRFPDTYTDDLRDQLKTIPIGTVLYDVLAIEEPHSLPFKIATLRTKSKFVTSKFGDQSLFFQHSYMDEDLELYPHWKEAAEVDPPIMTKLMEKFHNIHKF